MSLHSKLDNLLKLNKMSVTKLAKETGIPATTLYSLKSRKSNRININALKILADYFGVNINYFVKSFGEYDSDDIKITDDETELVLKYRALDDYGKHLINTILNLELYRMGNIAEFQIEVTTDGIEESKNVKVDVKELNDVLDELK